MIENVPNLKICFFVWSIKKKPFLTNPVFCVFRVKVKILYRLHLSSINSLGARTQKLFYFGSLFNPFSRKLKHVFLGVEMTDSISQWDVLKVCGR